MNNKDTPITKEIPNVWRIPPRNQGQIPAKFFFTQHSAKTFAATLEFYGEGVVYRRVLWGFNTH